jgi:glycosyltransferase involved in cell wall biosynthesis
VKSKNPLVSVIIPAYNSEKYIAEALDSVFAQTYRPIEVIVVDDGSTDGTADVVKKCQERFIGSNGFAGSTIKTGAANKTSLTYFYQKNSGPSVARNAGIKAARGEYVAFLDADDAWTDDKLEKQVALLQDHPDLDVVFTNVKTRKVKDGRVTEFELFEENRLGRDFFGHEYRVLHPLEKLLKLNFMLTPAIVTRRRCFERGFLFDERKRYAEDWELWLKMALFFNFGYLSDVCVKVIDEADGLSANKPGMILSAVKVLEDFLEENREEVYSRISQRTISSVLKDFYKWKGYALLLNGDAKPARKMFRKSLHESADVRTIIYYMRTFCTSSGGQKKILL